jgi:hypothetical protein
LIVTATLLAAATSSIEEIEDAEFRDVEIGEAAVGVEP